MSNNNIRKVWASALAGGALAATGQALIAPAHAEPLPYGPDTCVQGYVWREARPGDTVCVTPPIRDATAQENASASQNREPSGGPYGPDTCKQGFVWREAFAGDHVCVSPGSRTQAANDNAAAASRKAANAVKPGPAPERSPLCALPDPFRITPGC
jgi:hypothetical protein